MPNPAGSPVSEGSGGTEGREIGGGDVGRHHDEVAAAVRAACSGWGSATERRLSGTGRPQAAPLAAGIRGVGDAGADVDLLAGVA